MKKYFLLALICILGIQIKLSGNKITIQNLNEKFGLVKKRVNCMFQDSKGFIWFGMVNGLYKFDQSSFTSLSSRKFELNGFPEADVSAIKEIKPGLLLIGTFDKGLWIYNSQLMKSYSLYSDSAIDFSSLNVKCLYVDISGIIWVGTNKGLYWIKCEEKKLDKYKVEVLNNKWCSDCVSGDFVSIKKSKSGIIWFATMVGIGYYNPITKENHTTYLYEPISNFEFLDKNEILIGTYGNGLKLLDLKTSAIKKFNVQGISEKSFITYVYKDHDSNIWLSVSNEGLYFLGPDPKKSNMTFISNKDKQYTGLNSNTTLEIKESDDGTLWACTEDGVSTILLSRNHFQFFQCNTSSKNLTHPLAIRSLVNSNKGFLWAGTVGGGLKQFNLNTKKFENVTLLHQGKNIGNFVQTMMQDSRGELWLGTGGDGVIRFTPDKNTQYLNGTTINYRIYPRPFPEKTLLNDFIMCFLEDKHKNIWIGTWFGLSLIDSAQVVKKDQSQIVIRNFINNPLDSSSISNNTIMSLLEDREGNIWIGTRAGLNKIVKTKQGYKFRHHFKNKNGKLSPERSILCTYQSNNGKIWISSQGGGLYLFDPKEEMFEDFDLDNVFFENIITSIVENTDGSLWLASNNGLCSLDQTNYTFKIFTTEDGLIANDFLFASNCKADNNYYFGVNSGLIMFNPNNVKAQTFKLNLAFTEFRLFGKSIYPGSIASPLMYDISSEKNITLKHNQNFFTIFFNSINYKHQNEVYYAYKLEGLETSWNYLKKENWATYTNLSPGKYTFKVKAFSSNDDTNTAEISLKVTIQPPLWKTTFAYIFYAVVFIILLTLIHQFFLKREKRKNALTLERLNAKRIHEMDLMKLQFFTNISHEFRTPLTLISAPVETLIRENQESSKAQSYYNIILRNVQRLTKLIDQLLDLRKIEEGYLKVTWESGDIIEFIQKTFNTFKYYAEKRNINFTFHTECPELYTFFDSDKIDKVLFNLFSNALKYTADNGSISVNLAIKLQNEIPFKGIQASYLEVKISDSGIGIPNEYFEKIFKPFQQVDTNKPIGSKSTGIGLALTKELIDLHNGFIQVESELDKGSTFTIFLPVYLNSPDGDGKSSVAVASTPENAMPEEKNYKKEDTGLATTNKPLVLVVEDNSDMREFIRTELHKDFQIIESDNGQDGLTLAFEKIPDLVVSDIMMEKLDGIQLCTQLKSDERTSHIPVILLTARHADDVKLSGYETGADDYITKPFNVLLLISRIKNLIDQRRKLSELFTKRHAYGHQIVTHNKIDNQFLTKLNTFIEKNMDSPEYDPSLLASDMCMSKMQLYRKVAALTNDTVLSYIRTVRLNKAAHLLLNTNMQISEISTAVGFTEPTNFTRSFTKQFNQTPTQFRTNQN